MNVNRVSLKSGFLRSSARLYQYDYGQQIEFVGLELPEVFEVHFSNENHGESTVSLCENGIVDIPDIYLSTGLPIYGWIFLHNEETDGETIYDFQIPVTKRASVSESHPEPVEQDIITQAIAALNNAVVKTTQNAENALEAETLAVQAKQETEEIRDAVVQIADDVAIAQQKAEEAQDKAEEAEIQAGVYRDEAFSAASSAVHSFNDAEEAALLAKDYSLDSEAWAKGTRDSFVVDESDETWHNNSLYWAQRSMDSSQAAENNARIASEAADIAVESVADIAGYTARAEQAANSASDSASSALNSAQRAERAASTVSGLEERVNHNAEEIERVKNILANEYSSEKTYPVTGTYVIYDDALWISVLPITEPEEFTEEHWVQVAVGLRLMEMQEAIDIIMHMEDKKDMSLSLLRRICQAGKAMEYFEEGDVIYIPWTDYSKVVPVEYKLPFVVVHFEDIEDPDGYIHENAMFVMSMYAQPIEIPFDAPEAKIADTRTFVEGLYYYTVSNNVYVQRNVQYGSNIPSSPTYYVSNKSSAGDILKYGYSRWSQGAYEQWLNSNAASNWWAPKHSQDVGPDAEYTNMPGWLHGFTREWQDFFKPIKVQTAFGEETDVTYDTFFLPSLEQMYGIPQYPNVEGRYWQYWKDETGLNAPTNGSVNDTNDARKIPSVDNPEGDSVIIALRSAHTNGYSMWSDAKKGYFYLDSALNARRSQPVTALY